MLNKAEEKTSEERLWSLDNTVLGHQPGTQRDADKMSETIRQKMEQLTTAINIARGIISLDKIREKEEAEDGVMRVIE